MAKQVTVSIDGVQVSVNEGTLVVDAAKKAGIDIPVFCYHPKMEPAGMCRQCMVEIGRPVFDRASGQPVLDESGKQKIQFGAKLETSCTTPVSEGMQVLTKSEKARTSQKENLEFLLTSHPLDCPVCDKGGECPLQNLTLAYGPGKSRFIYDEKHHAEKHVSLGDLIWLDRERCIQCGRCIRFQEDIAGDPVLAFYQRGRNTDIITNSTPPFDSVFSGNTSDICPVGALTTVDFRFGARPWEMKAAASICSQCAVGCNISFNTRREAAADGRVVIKRVMPRQNEQVNEIWMCDKGRFAWHYTESRERLGKPLIRKSGKLTPATWAEAIKLAAGKLRSAKKDVVILAGGRLSNEDLFNLKCLADKLGGEKLLYSHMGGGDLTTSLGVSRPDDNSTGFDLGKLGPGSTILVAASDMYQEAPVWYLRVKQAAERGATLIVANARETKLEKYATYYVRYAYGDESATISGLLKKDKIGKILKEAGSLVIFYGSDGIGLSGSTDLATACAILLDETSRTGKADSALIGVWPHANDQGAWELGFKPVKDLAKAVKGKTVYIASADPVGDDPDLATALKGAKALIVQTLFQTATANLADVFLPAQAYTEREGSYTSGQRRVQRFYPAVPPLGQTRSDFRITADIAGMLGIELEGNSAAKVMEALSAAVETFAGISYQTLAEMHEQWPIIGRNDLYYGGTGYENKQGLGVVLNRAKNGPIPAVKGKGKGLHAVENKWLAVPITRLFNRGITIWTSNLLQEHIAETTVLLHPDSAKRLGLKPGGEMLLNGTKVTPRLDAGVPVSVVLVPRSLGLALPEPEFVSMKKG